MWRKRVVSTVSGQECHFSTGYGCQEDSVARRAVWRVNFDFLNILQEAVKA
jgi:hypothetical protein